MFTSVGQKLSEGGTDQVVKVVLLGDTGVGKSSLASRFVTNEFSPYSESTIGASFMSKTIEVPIQEGEANDENEEEEEEDDDSVSDSSNRNERARMNRRNRSRKEVKKRRINFKIWDTAGQEKYRSLAPMYYRGAGAAILVFDICSPVTFSTLQNWVEELRLNGPREIVLVVCGNKADLKEHRQVGYDEAWEYAASVGGFYIETSARENSNVGELFRRVGKLVPRVVESDASVIEGVVGNIELTSIDPSTEDERVGWLSWC